MVEKKSFKRIVLKLGTNVVTSESGGLEENRIRSILKEVNLFKKQGVEVIVVSSGAVGLGRQTLQEYEKNSLPFKQACAAIGQNLLISNYQKILSEYGIQVAQVLLTSEDLLDEKRYFNLREMLQELLSLGVVPIINENDSVSTMELKEDQVKKSFGDNDMLSARIATKLGADVLVLLTDVDGIYDENPKKNKEAKKINRVLDLKDFEKISKSKKSSHRGRGGMESKIEAVSLASRNGVSSVVASGLKEGVIQKALMESPGVEGTFICPQKGESDE